MFFWVTEASNGSEEHHIKDVCVQQIQYVSLMYFLLHCIQVHSGILNNIFDLNILFSDVTTRF